jgi:hypothetical protein
VSGHGVQAFNGCERFGAFANSSIAQILWNRLLLHLGLPRFKFPLSSTSYTYVVQSHTEEEQRMSEVLEGLLQKRASLAAELGALDAGIAAYRRALVPTKSAAVQVNGSRPTMSLASRKKLSLLAKARWAKKRKEEKK